SLIKNPGGGLAPAGGYIAGKKNLVDNAAERLVAPGLGKKTGPSLGNNRLLFQGLFMAPHAVAESLMGAVYCSAIMQWAGYTCSPGIFDERPDIIQSVEMGNSESLLEFCKGIQSGSPVDSHVTPVPWDMPGYDCPVIMAAGGFVQGASLELSADAPVAEPYTVFVQGGLVYENVKVAVMKAMSMLTEKGYIDENGKKC
ncbi:MAG: methionine gamma-lyase family protein, partial [Eubacteriales bacterium]|nr:methionine gamma-lyase family protein [Eubacteriales bacterium]